MVWCEPYLLALSKPQMKETFCQKNEYLVLGRERETSASRELTLTAQKALGKENQESACNGHLF